MAYTILDAEDIILGNVVQGVTSTAFSGNSGSLVAFFSSSTQTASNAGPYHYEVYNADPAANSAAEVQFSVAAGNAKGSGSARQTGASVGNSPTKAIYSQFRNLLLDNPTDTAQFTTADGVSHENMFFISMNRARYKQGVNAGSWYLELSSSYHTYASGTLKLRDDSTVSDGNVENGHLVYNIVSGSEASGIFADGSSNTHYWGKFYPDLGILALGGNYMTGSVNAGPQGSPGFSLKENGPATGLPASFDHSFLAAANTDDGFNDELFWSIKRGKYFALRAEEDVSSTHYFIRAKNQHYNYSMNHTYQRTGSNGEINGQLLHSTFIQNPQTFITTVGMYNDSNELLAIAKLSKPLLKNFERETTIRVKLDH